MSEEQRLNKALRDVQRQTQLWPRVKDLRGTLIKDSTGDDSVEVWVLLADDTSDAEVTGPQAQKLEKEIRKQLQRINGDRFPYVYFAREKEHDPSL